MEKKKMENEAVARREARGSRAETTHTKPSPASMALQKRLKRGCEAGSVSSQLLGLVKDNKTVSSGSSSSTALPAAPAFSSCCLVSQVENCEIV